MLSLDEVIEVPLVADVWARVKDRWPGLPQPRLIGELIREQIGRMVNDVITESRHRIAAAGPKNIDDVRQLARPLAGFSHDMSNEERVLKRFMYKRLYHHPRQLGISKRAGQIIAGACRSLFR